MSFSGGVTYSNNTHAEIVAILKGLQLATSLNIAHAVRYSYSKVALDLIVMPGILTIQDMLKLKLNVQLSHTLREGSQYADFLAKMGSTGDVN